MQVNGKKFNIDELEQKTLLGLLEHLNLKPAAIAVERNGQIEPRGDWSQITLKAEDRLELIRFVGGG